MIRAYELKLKPGEALPISADSAYRLYSWLLSQIPPELGDELHTQEDHPISQYVLREKSSGEITWRINLLGVRAAELFSPVLEGLSEIMLNAGVIAVEDIKKVSDLSFKDLILTGKDLSTNRSTLNVVSPTSFKQNGAYVIFPQERLIVRSLINRWNSFCHEYPLDDEDAVAMLESGIRISDYSLRTQRYSLKTARIPGFVGRISFTSGLPLPLAQLWGTLLCWAPYSGIGIKTALGMGGTILRE